MLHSTPGMAIVKFEGCHQQIANDTKIEIALTYRFCFQCLGITLTGLVQVSCGKAARYCFSRSNSVWRTLTHSTCVDIVFPPCGCLSYHGRHFPLYLSKSLDILLKGLTLALTCCRKRERRRSGRWRQSGAAPALDLGFGKLNEVWVQPKRPSRAWKLQGILFCACLNDLDVVVVS